MQIVFKGRLSQPMVDDEAALWSSITQDGYCTDDSSSGY